MEMSELPDMADKPAANGFSRLSTEDEAPTALDTLIRLLQGESTRTLADTGVARYEAHALDGIANAAERESEYCLDHMRSLLQLLDARLITGKPDPASDGMRCAVRHLSWLLANYQRWRALSENAAYYRDHPDIARQIAAYETRVKAT